MRDRRRYSLPRSFGHALRGVGQAVVWERNLRVHMLAALVVLLGARYYALTRAELAALVLCAGLVITCELFNSAVERVVDLYTTEYHRLAGLAKDIAAGAVFVSAATSVAVGFLLFWDIPTIRLVLRDQAAHPLRAALFLTAAALWIALPLGKKPK